MKDVLITSHRLILCETSQTSPASRTAVTSRTAWLLAVILASEKQLSDHEL